MERRDFFKISAITGAAATLDACGKPEQQLIRFIPDEDLVPGIATWKPSVCTLCPAGCGLTVRVMQGDAEVVRNGKLGLIRMGLAKKLEGNPQHPVNRGKLCARGQAGLQITYNPDRVRHPLKRSGPRGSAEFQEISWDDAVKELVSQLAALGKGSEPGALAFLTRPLSGQRREVVSRFLSGLGAPPAVTFAVFDEAVLRRANLLSFGRAQQPTVDLARADYVISFGADFLGTWNSPVAQSIGYGEMRQGRPGVRGKFVQVEPRMSQTGANADEWIPARPGSEGALALGIARVILSEKLRPRQAGGHARSLVAGWSDGLPKFTPEAVERLTGVPAAKITKLAREVAASSAAVAVIGGAPLAQTNGLGTALAVNALNELIGAVGREGGVAFTPDPPGSIGSSVATVSAMGAFSSVEQLAQEILLDRPGAPKVVLLYDANPAFGAPPGAQVRAALEKIPFIASFGSFIDETSALADLILPDHSPLESWLDDAPPSGSALTVASLAPPAMNPLHNTRAMPDVLLEVAQQLGGDVAKALPWKNYEAALKESFSTLQKQKGSIESTDADDFWKKAQAQGGWWSTEPTQVSIRTDASKKTAMKNAAPEFDGAPDQFPFHFLPFASQMFYDGSLAHLPWMQEAPDPLSSVMWGTWVEINNRTAE